MPFRWKLRAYLAIHHDIYRPSELQRVLEDQAGVTMSIQALSSLLHNPPAGLRLATMQALCNALQCRMSDFCDVVPDGEEAVVLRPLGAPPEPLYHRRPNTNLSVSIFPDPHVFKSQPGRRRKR